MLTKSNKSSANNSAQQMHYVILFELLYHYTTLLCYKIKAIDLKKKIYVE